MPKLSTKKRTGLEAFWRARHMAWKRWHLDYARIQAESKGPVRFGSTINMSEF